MSDIVAAITLLAATVLIIHLIKTSIAALSNKRENPSDCQHDIKSMH